MPLAHLLEWFMALNAWWQAIVLAGAVVTALAAINKYALRPFYRSVLRPATLGVIAAFRAAPQAVELLQSGLERLEQLTQLVARAQQGVDENTVDIHDLTERVGELGVNVERQRQAAGAAFDAAGAARHAAESRTEQPPAS